MDIQELKATVERHRSALKEKTGKLLISSEMGPVGIPLIDAIVATLETLEQRVKKLEENQVELT